MISNFSRMPSVSISRSKFLRRSQHKTSLKLGEITPIYLDEVLPGDTRSIDIGSLIRMSTPVAPVMDNVYLDIYAFFVPNRLTWSHWKEFMGENTSAAGIYTGTEYKIPMRDLFLNGVGVGTVGDHMGLPVLNYDATKHLLVSALPLRGYKLIYNRFFRDQNVIAPITVGLGDTETSSYNFAPYIAAKVSDYFTRSLPYAQKGAPVSIPLGTTAPVGIVLSNTSASNETWANVVTTGTGAFREAQIRDPNVSASGPQSLVTDLTNATAATINQLRFAFQYQKLLEKDALFGTRLNAR